MQFVEGASLQDRIDQGGIEIGEVLRISIETAEGLACAHSRGLVHRDVKPANILLEGPAARVKISDFGLAHAVDGTEFTRAGEVVGTPQFMAPEQARGEPVDARADLFSLGSVLYAMCSGSPPFTADSTLAVLRKVVDDRARPVRELNPDVPPRLAALIERLHAKNPGDRPSTAGEVADELRKIDDELEHPGDTSPLPWTSARKHSPDRSTPESRNIDLKQILWAVAAAALLIVAVVLFPLMKARGPAGSPGSGRPAGTRADRTRQRGQSLELTFHDAGSGRPVAGVAVNEPSTGVSVTTDGDGFCRLPAPDGTGQDPARVEKTRHLLVQAPGVSYFSFHLETPQDDTPLPKKIEINLKRGIEFRARVVEENSGRPLRGERVVYRPIAPNVAMDELLPESASHLFCPAVEVGDGVYRGVASGGPGLISVENARGAYLPATFKTAPENSEGDANAQDAAPMNSRLLRVALGKDRGVHLLPQDGLAGVAFIDPPPDSGPFEITITVVRRRIVEKDE